MSQKMVAVLLGASLLAFTGCSKEPVAEVAATQTAMQQAVSAEAEVYAPESYAAAQQKMSELNAELEAQKSKMGLMRKYGRATELTAEVQAASAKAAADAASNKEAMMAEATMAISETKAAIDAAMTLLGSAPSGKGSSADLEMMRQDLVAASSTLSEIEASFAQGKYADASAQAQALRTSIQAVHAELQAAIDAKAMAKTRG